MSPLALDMEDPPKPSIPTDASLSNDRRGASVDAQFAYFCKTGLSLNETTYTEAMKLFSENKHLCTTISAIGTGMCFAHEPEGAEHYWFAFVLYSVKRLSETNADDSSQGTGGDGFTLCRILRVARLNIVNFLKELPQFIVKAGPILSNQYGTDWEKRLEVLVLVELS
ncbi:Retinoblastoma-related protein [Camellia lanceoleosa]|uniref:Retinoblastoma-related protein n=1 Tax=Camellia lanceoleosa TaxID=1840588 RepID=A0ACC0GAD9_9ERIC|nr:Retinoblastoma-related protein [Camellia lanceoleosa]